MRMAMAATPPTTPPTMAPVLVDELDVWPGLGVCRPPPEVWVTVVVEGESGGCDGGDEELYEKVDELVGLELEGEVEGEGVGSVEDEGGGVVEDEVDEDGGTEDEDDDVVDEDVVDEEDDVLEVLVGTGIVEHPHPVPGGHGCTFCGSESMNVPSDELVTRTTTLHPSARLISGHCTFESGAVKVARFRFMLMGMAESTSLSSARGAA